MLTSNFKLSSRLGLVGIEMSEIDGELYNYKTIYFGLFSKIKYYEENLRIVYNLDNFEYNDVLELIDLLFENKLLKVIE